MIAAIAYFAILFLRKDGKRITGGHRWQGIRAWLSGRAAAGAILADWCYLTILFTVIFRPVYVTPRYHLELFWSYRQAAEGAGYLIYEIVLNYIMFMPEGILAPAVLDAFAVRRRHRFLWVVLIALTSSTAIECMQLVLRRGLFEFDDIIGNVAGAMIGYVIYKVIDIPGKKWIRSV